jgi:hypothetical protein
LVILQLDDPPLNCRWAVPLFGVVCFLSVLMLSLRSGFLDKKGTAQRQLSGRLFI